MNFESFGLKPEILSAVADLGFKEAMPVQEQVIPLLLQQETDLIALAQTGTGKTAAFGLPLLEKVDAQKRGVEALVLSPTRELCLQIATDLEKMASHLPGVRIGAVYGGASIDRQILEIERGLKIVVATPGRMLDILKRGKIKLDSIHTVVFDEADEMLNMGFREELDGILQYTPEEKRTWLFSATMPNEIRSMTKRYMDNPIEITVGRRNEGSANVTHHYYVVQARERYLALKRVIDYFPDIYSIIFCRTRRETQEVAEKLIKDGYNADALHGDLSQAQRDNAMSRFRLKNLQLLVATDVAARGLDVNNLTHVLNYNLPDDVEQYTHRSGRTGRATSTGISISFVTVKEKSRIKEIEKSIKKTFELKPLPSGEEVCGKQVLYQAERMLGVSWEEEEMESYLPAIYEKLQGLSKEELIQRFVALEFNRFLSYYRNAPEVQDMSIRPERSERGSRGDGHSFARLFINMGHMDGVKPQNLIGLINDYVKDRDIKIGRIELCKTCSFIEIDVSSQEKVVQALKGAMYGDRKVVAEISRGNGDRDREPEEDRGGYGRGRSSGSRGDDRGGYGRGRSSGGRGEDRGGYGGGRSGGARRDYRGDDGKGEGQRRTTSRRKETDDTQKKALDTGRKPWMDLMAGGFDKFKSDSDKGGKGREKRKGTRKSK